jgi:hypothetical protein
VEKSLPCGTQENSPDNWAKSAVLTIANISTVTIKSIIIIDMFINGMFSVSTIIGATVTITITGSVSTSITITINVSTITRNQM